MQLQYMKQFGRIYGTLTGTVPIVWIAEPDIIKEITVKNFNYFVNRHQDIPLTIDVLRYGIVLLRDEKWKRVRKILSPTFSTSKLKQTLVIINDTCQQLLQTLLQQVTTSKSPSSSSSISSSLPSASQDQNQAQIVNITELYTQAIMKSTLANSFGICTNLKDKNDKLANAVSTIFLNQGPALILASISPYLTMFFAKLIPGTFSAFQVLDDTVKQAIKTKKAENPNERRQDLLNLLLESHDGDMLNEVEISAQATTFLLGGYESTRNTLIFATYLITTHPEVQQKLIDEIDSQCPDQSSLTYENINQLPYLDMIINEVLRLYPSFYEISRDVEADITIGGIELHRGDVIKIPVYSLHHDSEFWPDPDKFIPERFDTDAKQDRHHYAYLPFGLGPRSCIGMRLALFTIKLFLVKQLQQFEFKVCDQTVPSLRVQAGASISPLDDVYIQMLKRY